MNGGQLGSVVVWVGFGVYMLYWLSKKQAADTLAAERIVQEGGEILSRGSIGMLVADPFLHSTSDAAGQFYRVRYGARTGTWFVRTSSKRPEGEWLWVDGAGEAGLPVSRSDDSRAVPTVRRIPHWVAAAVIGAIVLVGPIIGVVLAKGH